MSKNLGKRMLSIFVMATMILIIPISTFAASNPYNDVTKASMDSDTYKAIKYVKKHGGYKNVITGKEFHPEQKITRAEFLTMMGNFYGNKNIRVSLVDVRKASKGITTKYAVNKLVKLANRHFKVRFGWAYGSSQGMSPYGQKKPVSKTITRAEASEILYHFAKANKKFRPKK